MKQRIMIVSLFVLMSAWISNDLYAKETVILDAEDDLFAACEVTGSATFYDLASDRWLMTNEDDAQKRTLPASTFKVFHSLIALDRGVTRADEVFLWDGVERSIAVWNQDTRFEDAFKNSTVWVYEAVAERMDLEVYKRYMSWAAYEGNQNIEHGKGKNFWVHGDFGVSPQEQIKMLVKLYKNELPFSQASMDKVKEFMCEGNTCSKTGWTQKDGQHIGWWIGYRNLEQGPLFFATRIMKDTEKEFQNFSACRKSITENLIQQVAI